MTSAMVKALNSGNSTYSAEEEWRQVLGGWYAVSSLGRVRHLRTERLINPIWMKNLRYWAIAITTEKKTGSYVGYGKLVAEAFLGKRPPLAKLCYRDGDTRNANVANLFYATKEELRLAGESKSNSGNYMDIKDIQDIGTFYNQYPEATLAECIEFFTMGNGVRLYTEDQIRYARLESGVAQLSLFKDEPDECKNEGTD